MAGRSPGYQQALVTETNVLSPANMWYLGYQPQPPTARRSQVLRNGQWPVYKEHR